MTPEQSKLQPTLQSRLANPLKSAAAAANQRAEHRLAAQKFRAKSAPKNLASGIGQMKTEIKDNPLVLAAIGPIRPVPKITDPRLLANAERVRRATAESPRMTLEEARAQTPGWQQAVLNAAERDKKRRLKNSPPAEK